MMLTCRDTTERFTDVEESRTSIGVSLAYRAHLSICPHCRLYVSQMKSTIEALRALPPPDPPRASVDAAVAALKRKSP